MRWDQIDLDEGTIQVKRVKRGNPRNHSMDRDELRDLLGGGMVFTILIAAALLVTRGGDRRLWTDAFGRMVWRMPALDQLPPAQLTPLTRIWLGVLRGYLIVAGGLVLWRTVDLALCAG